MIISTEFARAFNKAVSNPENIQSNGLIDWNYVDSDVFMDTRYDDEDITTASAESVRHYDQFDYLITQYESTVQSRIVQDNRITQADLDDLRIDPLKPIKIERVL
jgi:hypothetical protein